MQTEILYSESQKVFDASPFIILGLVNLLFIALLIKGFKNKNRTQLAGTFFGFLVVIAVTLLTLNLKLCTEIKKDGVYVKLFPLQLKQAHYNWSDISKAYVRTYKPVAEYGGWGLKGSEHNSAISVSGNVGLQLIFKNGDKLLIGTNHAQKLSQTLKKIDIPNAL